MKLLPRCSSAVWPVSWKEHWCMRMLEQLKALQQLWVHTSCSVGINSADKCKHQVTTTDMPLLLSMQDWEPHTFVTLSMPALRMHSCPCSVGSLSGAWSSSPAGCCQTCTPSFSKPAPCTLASPASPSLAPSQNMRMHARYGTQVPAGLCVAAGTGQEQQ